MAELSPMMQQFLQIKEQNKDAIIFFRLGDFYETFFDQAKVVSRELELTLTGRDCGLEERAPMCGVPYHSYESHVARLVAKGYKVAICEQTEDPAQAKGLVKREVVRVLTPGTVIEGSMLDEGRNNFLAVVYGTAHSVGVCFCDSSTGQVYATQINGEDLADRVNNELGRYMPSEILVNDTIAQNGTVSDFITNRLGGTMEQRSDDEFDIAIATQAVPAQFGKSKAEELDLGDKPAALIAVGCALHYLALTQMTGLERVNKLQVYEDNQHMRLDITARRNLELLETMRAKEKRGSLLGVLDKTKTAMGKRLLRSWIEQPLIKLAPITRRLSAVDELVHNAILRDDIREELSYIYDLERIMTRIVYGSANARELRSLQQTLERLPRLRALLSTCQSTLLQDTYSQIDSLEDICGLIAESIDDEPPITVREGDMIRPGYNAELDELRSIMKDGKSVMTRIEAEEKEKYGIKTLKVGYNRVFGYYIEISRLYSDQVPPHYIRKQTLANAERYITQELKELEAKVLGARDHAHALEYQLLCQVRETVASQLVRIQTTATALASLDVLASFAQVAATSNYCRPEVDMSGRIHIQNGRHPVVENLSNAPFVPNDTTLDNGENRVAIITGPNMAGKSTYMRQTALIVLMAQIGSFVPADSATIGIVDSIFTRVGASDDLAAGQSTFMVEMSEVASILRNATSNSLIVFDEIGRGTSTFDGMSIARAVLEYVANPARIGAKTLFATHYHELTVIEEESDCIKNYNIAVKKRGDDVTFLRRILRGPADDSYGIQVAKLAGINDEVVERAKEILRSAESEEHSSPHRVAPVMPSEDNDQLSLMGMCENPLIQQLKDLDVNVLTPIEAMQTLYDLAQQAKSY